MEEYSLRSQVFQTIRDGNATFSGGLVADTGSFVALRGT